MARRKIQGRPAPRPLLVMRSRLSFVSHLLLYCPAPLCLLVHAHVPLKHCLLYIMLSSCSSSRDVSEGLASPPVEGRHLQFFNFPTFIDGQVVADVPRKNKYREPKKIPYAVPLFEPGTPSWSSCEYSSTLNILNPEVKVTMAKTKSTPRIRSPDELLAEGTQGNHYLPEAKVASTSSSASSCSSGSSSRHSSRSPSSERASTSSSSFEASLGPGKSVVKRKGCTPAVTEIMAEGSKFPGAPTRSDPQDGPGSHFPDPKVVTKLKRSTLEKQSPSIPS
ncbi:hypothetical protein Cgig2_031929 [Carnegiea gigantea]|uniref:Uncharacterized protein n=1 Tax=Carnegiea gigantea TaxID=171969 RepID=A0A9Q1GTS1_9CARY|nr:hypothetical protein Cgig2_031929 [Carnegiea gigantea]